MTQQNILIVLIIMIVAISALIGVIAMIKFKPQKNKTKQSDAHQPSVSRYFFGKDYKQNRKEEPVSPQPEKKFQPGCLVFLILLIIIFGYWVINDAVTSQYYQETKATLDNQYTKTTRTKRRMFVVPVSTSVSYSVTYTYTVDGRRYWGEATLSDAPSGRDIKIFYDSRDPSKSSLKKKIPIFSMILLIFFTMFLLAHVIDVWKGNYRKKV